MFEIIINNSFKALVILCGFTISGHWIPAYSAAPLKDLFSHDFLKNKVCCCSTKLNVHGPFQPSSDYNLLAANTNHNLNLIKGNRLKDIQKRKTAALLRASRWHP